MPNDATIRVSSEASHPLAFHLISFDLSRHSAQFGTVCCNASMELKNIEIQVHVDGLPLIEHNVCYSQDLLGARCFIASEAGKVCRLPFQSFPCVYSHSEKSGVQANAAKSWRAERHVRVRGIRRRRLGRQVFLNSSLGQGSRWNMCLRREISAVCLLKCAIDRCVPLNACYPHKFD